MGRDEKLRFDLSLASHLSAGHGWLRDRRFVNVDHHHDYEELCSG
jgi:hypothetical protein